MKACENAQLQNYEGGGAPHGDGACDYGKDMAKKSLAEKWRRCLPGCHCFYGDFFAFHQSVEICANLWIKRFEASTTRGLVLYSTAIFDPQIFLPQNF